MLPSTQELSNLLGMLYDAASDPPLWAAFIEQLARRTKSASAALLIQSYDQGLYSLSNSWRMPEESVRAYQEHYHILDVWAEVALPRPNGYICTSQSLCALREMKTNEFYNDFLVDAGIEHGMFAILENNKSCLASVCLYRDKTRTEFTDSDLRILHFLGPHLRRAFKLHFHVSELKAHSAGVEAALGMLSTGVILLGSRGEIVLMNSSASASVAEKDGLLVTKAGLQAERQEESAMLTQMIQHATSTSNGKGVSAGGTVLVSRRTRPPLQIQISPIHNSLVGTSQRVAAVAFIVDPLRTQRPAERLLRAFYGLTVAECRVALLLSDGHAPREIAEKVGVTDNTVRSQIKSIFSKTGVKRQGELIRLLLGYAGTSLTNSVGGFRHTSDVTG